MYKVIGQDGKEYGPASAEQIREWINQKRVDARTPVFPDGAKDWTFVGLLPEFSSHFSPPNITPTISAQPVRRTSGMAIAGMVCGILSLLVCFCCGGFPFNLLALIFSISALNRIGKEPELYEGRSMAWAGIVLAIISFLIFLALFLSGNANASYRFGQF